jgi:hypothetical protein
LADNAIIMTTENTEDCGTKDVAKSSTKGSSPNAASSPDPAPGDAVLNILASEVPLEADVSSYWIGTRTS